MSKLEPKPWHARSMCAGQDPAIFFPEPITTETAAAKPRTNRKTKKNGSPTKSEREYQRKVERSKAICAQCPVQSECRDYADAHRLRIGTYAGETSEERAIRWRAEHRRRAM